MRAARCRAYGPPETLVIEDLPSLALAAGQVRVRVHAASVNYPDVLIMANRYQVSAELPFTPGSEFAGVLSEVAHDVVDLKPGDCVAGATFVGAFAEEVVASAQGLRKLADDSGGTAFADAAAFSVAYGTAFHALRSFARLEPGQTLVVLGAAGGVGLAAVQIARLMGARVIAAASSKSKLEVCMSLGAEAGIDYTTEDLKQRIRDLTDGRGADAVLDPVGGAYSEPALRSTRWRGRFVTVGFASGEIPKIPLNLVLLKGVDIIGFDMQSFGRFGGSELTSNQAELWDWFDSGQLRPHISSVHPLESAAAALAEVAARRATGKVVIRMP